MVEIMAGAGYVMPLQTYRCPEHGKFELMVPIKDDVPSSLPCIAGPEPFDQTTACGLDSPWVPPTVSFPGGPTTGAKPPSLPEE